MFSPYVQSFIFQDECSAVFKIPLVECREASLVQVFSLSDQCHPATKQSLLRGDKSDQVWLLAGAFLLHRLRCYAQRSQLALYANPLLVSHIRSSARMARTTSPCRTALRNSLLARALLSALGAAATMRPTVPPPPFTISSSKNQG
jgi:hypothetical protein